jgi:phytol kinase
MWHPSLPPAGTCAWLAPALAILTLGTGLAAGWLKLHRGFRTGDTRKIFHFVVFTTAALLRLGLGSIEAVNLLGGIVALQVGAALLQGDGGLLYEALARESDSPRRSLHIVLPFLATAAGGIASAALFGPFSAVGFAVAGWGDAVGEPVGSRFGKHRFRVPGIGGVRATRSVEGSLAVLAASWAAAAIALVWLGGSAPRPGVLAAAFGIAAAATIIEALTHHGLDNFTVQLGASAVAWALGDTLAA